VVRYKGQVRPNDIEKGFPNIVEMPVPEGGLGRRLDEMHEWHRSRDLESRHGVGSRSASVWFVHWCFLNREDAEAFVSRFGGQLLGPKHLSRRRPARTGRG
jgi:hypothetical protein